jgi:hypothetical protein
VVTFFSGGRYARDSDRLTFDEISNVTKQLRDGVSVTNLRSASTLNTPELFMREGRPDLAVSTGAPAIPHWGSYKMLLACAQHRPDAEIAALVPGAEIDEDPESTYLFAGHLSYCGQTEEALRFLKGAVKANYCSYPAMDIDPMLANIRRNPKFGEVREAAQR